MIVTVIIGIAGAFVGGSLSSFLGFGSFTGFNPKSIVIAVAGAVLLLAGYRMLKEKR
jgi:uncharacterized membrane protein YeaQ/YmgE (transglycosylase-associated protein family)